MKINLSGIQQTLLIPLWSRAKLTKEGNSILIDSTSVDLVNKIEFDFSKIDKYFPYVLHIQNLVRAKMFDNIILDFLKNHPQATIVNLGAGLDTTFYCVDNGLLNWYDIDLPEVIEIRRKLISETDRSHYIDESIFDMQWLNRINKNKDGLLFISGGVLEYFDKKVVKNFFSNLANNFPESEIAFNTVRNNLIISILNKGFMKRLGMKSARAKWKFNFIEKIKLWDKRIIILEEYPVFSKISMEKNWDKNVIKVINFYNKHKIITIAHLKFIK